ncbi:MAG TPA: ribosome maturation factor RimP [Acidobacteriaceae bacterium]|nr:ribosome maturation factor RimP [Acidobacteriaceae bacterium]
MAADLEKIRATAERVASSYGLDAVDVEFVGGGKHRVLRVSIEKNAAGRAKLAAEAKAAAERGTANDDGVLPAAVLRGELSTEHLSGVTHEDCERFSHDFGTVIDVEDLVPGAEYTLEVSSPGLDRKLSRAADYERFRGSLVKLQTLQPVAGNRHWQGRLTAVDLNAANGGRITLDRSAIQAKGKAKKAAAGDAPVEIELANIEKAQLVPEL